MTWLVCERQQHSSMLGPAQEGKVVQQRRTMGRSQGVGQAHCCDHEDMDDIAPCRGITWTK